MTFLDDLKAKIAEQETEEGKRTYILVFFDEAKSRVAYCKEMLEVYDYLGKELVSMGMAVSTDMIDIDGVEN